MITNHHQQWSVWPNIITDYQLRISGWCFLLIKISLICPQQKTWFQIKCFRKKLVNPAQRTIAVKPVNALWAKNYNFAKLTEQCLLSLFACLCPKGRLPDYDKWSVLSQLICAAVPSIGPLCCGGSAGPPYCPLPGELRLESSIGTGSSKPKGHITASEQEVGDGRN